MSKVDFRTGFLCALIALLTTQLTSAEPIQYLDQDRSVAANAHAEAGILADDSDMAVAPDFGAFDELVSADAVVPLAFGHGDAAQISELNDTFISAFGSANAVATVDPTGSASADASSLMSVTFELNAPSDYTLDGMLNFLEVNPQLPQDGVIIALVGQNSGTVFSHSLNTTGSLALAEGGTLPADIYDFDVSVVSSVATPLEGGSAHVARGSFDVALVIPEPQTAVTIMIGLLILILPHHGRRRLSTGS